MKKIPLWKRVLAKLFWMILGVVVLTLIVALDEAWKIKSGHSEYAESYSVSWNAFNYYLSLKKDGKTLARFQVPKRPLAVWYRARTGTVVIVAAENGLVADNHLLYIWKNGRLNKLYHAVEGYDERYAVWKNSWLYPFSGDKEKAKNYVYLTPNEELLIARETNDWSYSERVFSVPLNGLSAYRSYSWNQDDIYWSPSGRCMVVLGEDSIDAMGYFYKPNDFVYSSSVYINVFDRSNIKVRWASENPCASYISMHGDYPGGEGAKQILDSDFYFSLETNKGTNELTSLPTNFNKLAESMKDDWQMVMVTYP